MPIERVAVGEVIGAGSAARVHRQRPSRTRRSQPLYPREGDEAGCARGFPSSCGTPLAWQELAARCWATSDTPRERPPMEEVKRAMEAVGTAGALGM